jgi:hypothetical protein
MGTKDDDEWLTKALNNPDRQTKHLVTPEGVVLYPLGGYTTATISATGALLSIEFVVPPPESGTRILRLGMTRAQCTELSEALKRLAVLPYNPQSKPS